LSLARCPASACYAYSNGMSHEGRDRSRSLSLVRPHLSGSHNRSARCIWNSLGSLTNMPTPSRDLFRLEPDGVAVINRDKTRQFAYLKRRAKEPRGADRVIRRAEEATRASSNARFIRAARPSGDRSPAPALTYKIGAPGRHLVTILWRSWRAAELAGADLALPALALAAQAGVRPRRADRDRASRRPALVIDRELHPIRLRSMRRSLCSPAAIGPHGRRSPCSATCWSSDPRAAHCTAPCRPGSPWVDLVSAAAR